ncbi:MAG: hypothetical protein KBD60_14105, partial [Sterolibacterium sp.]|nr:hypothetical protein [Sterolibacterium sp.]
TDALTEGATNLYHTAGRVLGQVLTGLSTAAGTVVEATHTILQAIGFLQKQVSDNTSAISGKQATLVSGTNIKTVNSTSLLGSGDLTVSAAPGGSTTQVQFNDGGALAGDSGLTYNSTTDVLTAAGGFSSTVAGTVPSYYFTNLTTGPALRANSDVIEVVNGSNNAFKALKANAFYSGTTAAFNLSGGGYLGTGNNSDTLQVNTGSSTYGLAGCAGITIYGRSNTSLDLRLERNAAGVVEINNGTAGTFRDLKLRNLIASGGVVTLASFTVATLPSASTSGAGAMAYVTDSNATTYRATVAGGGSDKVTVTSDGTNWIITG